MLKKLYDMKILFILLFLPFLCLETHAKTSSIRKDFPFTSVLTLGSPKAPLLMKEYSTPTCHICGAFVQDILPYLMQKYIIPGKLRLQISCLPYNKVDLEIATLIYQSSDPHKAYVLLLENQSVWLDFPTSSLSKNSSRKNIVLEKSPAAKARALLESKGLSFSSLYTDRFIQDALIHQRLKIEKKSKIEGLPIFIIGKTTIQGLISRECFDKVIQNALQHVNKGYPLKDFFEKI